MTNKVKLIKEEIERQIEEGKVKCQQSEENNSYESFVAWSEHVATCGKLLVFINSLPEESASEDKSEKELAETYLAVFDKKYPILPTLKGKQKADFKNFLNKCQQEFGLKEFGIHPTQSKLFEKLTLLWATWGAEHLEGLGKSNQDEFDKEPASEDLEEEIEIYSNNVHFPICYDDYKRFARHFAEWQKQQMMKDTVEGTIKYEIGSAEIPQCDRRYQVLSYQVHIPNAKLGDKVKIIILKTE